ncbi:MAG: hypothetical protein RLZZ23_507 [Verrucomicrobiota bacterium]|jgi:hypothetical protein
MISIDDIIQDNETRGELRLRLSVRALLRALILIGQLPRSRARTELLAAYDGLVDTRTDFCRLVPRGFSTERDLKANDVEGLTREERVSFLKGVALLLEGRLISGKHCICNMPAAVILPVAAYASLLREDIGLARKTWKAFAKIPRLCAEKLQIEKEETDEHLDLRKLTFEQFIAEVTGSRRDLSEVELGRLTAERIEKAFELERHRDRNRL